MGDIDLCCDIYVMLTKIKNITSGPFRRFSTCKWQNACINTVMRVMVCDVYFPFPRICNFIKGIIFIVFLKKLRQMFLFFTY